MFQINFVNYNDCAGKRTKNDGRSIQTVLMEQKLEEKMHHILSNCIQHHQVILRWGWTRGCSLSDVKKVVAVALQHIVR